MYKFLFILLLIVKFSNICYAQVKVGIDNLFLKENKHFLYKKKIGLITNHTAINSQMESTLDLLIKNQKNFEYTLKAIFAPEHGLKGEAYANEQLNSHMTLDNLPVYTLYGKTTRPTPEMLKNLDLIIYDIQDIGARSYTYCTTLFYVMEEAAKANIEILVLDRPNPINGITVDGPMLDEKFRSMVGYINVPYCHGMTIGELAQFFNEEYKIKCKLNVIPMSHWNREMTFEETGLQWVPTSPQIPEATTAYYYPMTGIIGEISLLNIGVGYTLPFKVVGAPWINGEELASKLNKQKFPGVYFAPFQYRPFYGKYAHEVCKGILIFVTDHKKFKPVSTQYLILGMIKNLYPQKFKEAMLASKLKKEMFHKVNGTDEIFNILMNEEYIIWPLRAFHKKERDEFIKKRKKYLIPLYNKIGETSEYNKPHKIR